MGCDVFAFIRVNSGVFGDGAVCAIPSYFKTDGIDQTDSELYASSRSQAKARLNSSGIREAF